MNNENIDSSTTSNVNKININDVPIRSEGSNQDTRIDINTSLTTASPIPSKSLDYTHEETMMDKKYNYEKQLLDKKLGCLGKFFGHEYILPLNVSGLFILILVFFLVFISYFIFNKTYNSEISNKIEYETAIEIIESLWNAVAPLLTLALGYLFGKKDS